MNIFVSCPEMEDYLGIDCCYWLVELLQNRGDKVLNLRFIPFTTLLPAQSIQGKKYYNEIIELLQKSDALIAEVSTPSLQVGYQIAFATKEKIPILCCYRNNVNLSRLILGNPNNVLCPYQDKDDALQGVLDFLSSL